MKTKLCRPVLVESKDKSPIFSYNRVVFAFHPHIHNNEDDTFFYNLILISLCPDEKIEVGDLVADGIEIIKASPKIVESQGMINRREWNKVIATQSQLSPEYIQQFIAEYNKGEVKDVVIEMEESLIKVYDNLGGHPGGHWESNGLKPLLTNGFITIINVDKPITYTEEEVRQIVENLGAEFMCDDGDFFEKKDIEISDIHDWFEIYKKK